MVNPNLPGSSPGPSPGSLEVLMLEAEIDKANAETKKFQAEEEKATHETKTSWIRHLLQALPFVIALASVVFTGWYQLRQSDRQQALVTIDQSMRELDLARREAKIEVDELNRELEDKQADLLLATGKEQAAIRHVRELTDLATDLVEEGLATKITESCALEHAELEFDYAKCLILGAADVLERANTEVECAQQAEAESMECVYRLIDLAQQLLKNPPLSRTVDYCADLYPDLGLEYVECVIEETIDTAVSDDE